MQKAQQYREYARQCDRLLEQVDDPRVRQQLRRERQDWLEMAASREAALRDRLNTPLDKDLTLEAMKAFERGAPPTRRYG